jgi:hypothetical protein
MAIIQIKRRTSSGTGPLVGSSGTIKAGEPLVDLNGGNLFISKQDKTGSSGNPIALADYIEYLSKPNADTLMNSKITALSLGTASKKNTGTTNGTVPLIGANNKLPTSIIPDVAPVTSVNSKTGAVTITLSELGGVSASTYNAHVSSNLHLTPEQRGRIENTYTSSIHASNGMAEVSTITAFNNAVLGNGLVVYPVYNSSYNPPKITYYIGIDKDKIIGPTSVIDGGTY